VNDGSKLTKFTENDGSVTILEEVTALATGTHQTLEEATVSLAWEIFKYACISFSVGLVLTLILLRIPHTRRKILALAERMAAWHESGVQGLEDDQWYRQTPKDNDSR